MIFTFGEMAYVESCNDSTASPSINEKAQSFVNKTAPDTSALAAMIASGSLSRLLLRSLIISSRTASVN